MVEISLSGSGEGPGWVTAPGYSTAGFSRGPMHGLPHIGAMSSLRCIEGLLDVAELPQLLLRGC